MAKRGKGIFRIYKGLVLVSNTVKTHNCTIWSVFSAWDIVWQQEGDFGAEKLHTPRTLLYGVFQEDVLQPHEEISPYQQPETWDTEYETLNGLNKIPSVEVNSPNTVPIAASFLLPSKMPPSNQNTVANLLLIKITGSLLLRPC